MQLDCANVPVASASRLCHDMKIMVTVKCVAVASIAIMNIDRRLTRHNRHHAREEDTVFEYSLRVDLRLKNNNYAEFLEKKRESKNSRGLTFLPITEHDE